MALASFKPHRLLALGALASLVLVPTGVAVVARTEGFNAVAVRWNLGWGLALPLPAAMAWVLFALFGLAVYLAVAVPIYLFRRDRAVPARNSATLLALASATVVALAILVAWLDLWRP
ncbi:MAG: hypothetical protein ACM3OB_03085 [Acidobacteriota bacterium]